MNPQEFMQRQKLPYEAKLAHAEIKAREFYAKVDNCHVSVGGLDSITLLLFLRSLGIDVPAISVSSIEDVSIQRVHKQLGIIAVRPYKTQKQAIQDCGFPVLSKQTAGKIELLANPTDKNSTVRHAIMTGETGKQGGYRTGTRMKLSQKWLNLFGGYENEKYGTDYKIPNFKVSNKCCYYLKEKPCDDWARANGNSKPYLGLMASEGGQREKALMNHGCNYYGKTTTRSCPFAIFSRQDLLQLALDLNVPVPEIYGEIVRDEDGTLRTTRAQRTGCFFCGFGIHLEKRPHRFDRLHEDNPKVWEHLMNNLLTDESGTYGWGRVLDYIGVGWREQDEQMTLCMDCPNKSAQQHQKGKRDAD